MVGMVKLDLGIAGITSDAPGMMDKCGALDSVYRCGSAARRKDGQYASACAKVDHTLARGHLFDSSLVAAGSNRVFQHHLMDRSVPVGLGKRFFVMGTFHERRPTTAPLA